MKHTVTFVAAILLGILSPLRAADLKLAAIFSDHMVLQRDKPVPVWGWADAGESITLDFGGQSKSATADATGKWQVKLEPLAASADPRVLRVRSEKPDRKTEISDVLVGEVWLGSGQSNMAMRVSAARDYKNEQPAADLPLIRSFNEGSGTSSKPQADASGKWSVCSPETVGTFSATLYYFGRELQRELSVPVGLINSSVGGTPIESWISAEAQAQVPELKNSGTTPAKGPAAADDAAQKAAHGKQLARWKQLAAKAKKEGKAPPPRPRDPAAAKTGKGGPGGLFNGKIAPLVPCALRGVLWYQGEANTHPGKGQLYQHQLPTLVTDWRKCWSEELPFAWVQLPGFNRPGEGWSLVREAMLKTLRLPKTGMAITVDIGDAADIHPKNKQEVGRRLSLWALGSVYDRKVSATSGPLPAGHEIKDNTIIVAFKHTEGGLVAKDGALTGFLIAGGDKQWKPAQATIDGGKVIVSSSEVAKPVAVRYAWASVPVCNLFNGAGLPASPFRTDAWPVNDAKTN